MKPRCPRRWAIAGLVTISLTVSVRAQPTTSYLVQRVVDGDTVVLDQIGTVRLIGVDTPETVDPRKPVQAFGVEASRFLTSMLSGKSVRLDYDHDRTDKYRRTLAYLYLPDGTFVNLEIVRQGFGHAYVTYPFRYLEDFRAAEREAREAGRGLWALPEQAAAPASTPDRVWVNTSARVYHCPGTRYYGNTARGSYMTEREALEKGSRAAYGRGCGATDSPPTGASTIATAAPKNAAASAKASGTASAASSVKVWVNTSSKVYHCPGTRYYGTTQRGTYMTEDEAKSAGHRPAGGRSCS